MFGHILTSFRVPFAIALVVLLLAASQSAGSVHAASLNVDQADPNCETGPGTPYCTIGAAVNAANAGDTINVFPGTYAESVDLGTMAVPDDITLVTVDASGTPTPSTVTVSPTTGEAFLADGPFPGNITIDGFNVTSPDSDGIRLITSGEVVIQNVTANSALHGFWLEDSTDVSLSGLTSNGNGHDGFTIVDSGTVSVSDCAGSNNGEVGFDIVASGTVTVSGSAGNGNGIDGIRLETPGVITVTGSTANNNGNEGFFVPAGGNLAVTNATANDNGDEGFEIDDVDEDATFDGVTANGNVNDGIDIEPVEVDVNNVTVVNSRFESDVDDGIDLAGLDAAGAHAINSNIICANGNEGLVQVVGSDGALGAEGNWWGAASGPTHPGNPPGTGDPVVDSANGGGGTVDFDPWIDTIGGSAGAATIGQPVVVTFQFTGGSGAVSLAEGPGDPNGSPPFSATTDNGAVTTSGFIDSGKLEVTLTPDTVGEATVTVTGPCGLDETTGGNSVILDVAAAPAEATPTPTAEATPTATPAELPTTGGEPGSGGGAWTLAIVLLAAGALALAGAGGLVAVRRRR